MKNPLPLLIVCHARDDIATVLIQHDREYFIIETVDDDRDCIAYSTTNNLQEAWDEYTYQKGMTK